MFWGRKASMGGSVLSINDKLFNGYGYVYEVYKTRSFSKAAENLFISQSSLSATIRKIENRIGVEIFDRSTIPVGLTEDGVEYIKAVEQIIDIEHYFESRVQQLDELVTGHLSVGGSGIYLGNTLLPVLHEFARLYPGVQVRLVEGGRQQLEKQLADNMLDLMVDNGVLPQENYTGIHLIHEDMLLAVPAQWPVNGQLTPYQLTPRDILSDRHRSEEVPVVPLEAFAHLPFTLMGAGNDTRMRAERLFFHYNLSPPIVLKVDEQYTALSLAGNGVAAAFISDCVARNRQSEDGVVYYRLPPEFARRNVSMYYKKNHLRTRSMEEFIRITENTAF